MIGRLRAVGTALARRELLTKPGFVTGSTAIIRT